jgi:manganese/zinc/iron transport system substrate-binding protein
MSGCTPREGSRSTSSAQAGLPIRVVATVGMVADLVRNVGKDRIAVTQLMGPGVDPHLYKTTRDDVAAILSADIVFYSGLMLEGKMTDSLVKAGRQKPVFAITEGLAPASLLEPAGSRGHFDPHVWMDVAAWSQGLSVIVAELAKIAPAFEAEFRSNAAAYGQQLSLLHQFGLNSIETIPKEKRILITSHDAFSYFGRAYGLQVRGIQGISTESEAGLLAINELVDYLVANQVEAVFVESSVPRKSIETLVKGAAAQGHAISVGGELFSDAMGEAGTYEGTYIGMLDHNFTTVTKALGGKVAERTFLKSEEPTAK